jgi:hypothetical protein
MTDPPRQLSSAELHAWQQGIDEANKNNILCHCRQCDREWVASTNESCSCGAIVWSILPAGSFPMIKPIEQARQLSLSAPL